MVKNKNSTVMAPFLHLFMQFVNGPKEKRTRTAVYFEKKVKPLPTYVRTKRSLTFQLTMTFSWSTRDQRMHIETI